jgi:hypothetical protein
MGSIKKIVTLLLVCYVPRLVPLDYQEQERALDFLPFGMPLKDGEEIV